MPKFPIVGMQFRPSEGIPAPTIMSLLPPGTSLFLVRQPENEYDFNAIQVWISNVAEVVPDSLSDIQEACVDKEGKPYECPNLAGPIMLGFLKAKTISDDVQGSDVLAPRIDAMVAEGTIQSASEIPCELVYGESGRPALRIKEATPEDVASPAYSGPVGMTNDYATAEAAEKMDAGFSEDFEEDRAFLNGDDQLEGEVEGLSEEDLEELEDEFEEDEDEFLEDEFEDEDEDLDTTVDER